MEPVTDDDVERAFRALARVSLDSAKASVAPLPEATRRQASVDSPNSPPPPPWRARQPRFLLGDLVLPPVTRNQLEAALAKLKFHDVVYEDWGFSGVDPTGRSATLCLYGPPGTGKTRAAEALAGAMGKPLLAISAGDVESRYFGETPKNVKTIFEAAQDQSAVLFFDEADSLFGRRASDVTQGVDHEVNATKSTLLMLVEQFEGVLVLATNFERNLDPAFHRRITWTVEFLKPDADGRRALWDMHIPSKVPLAISRAELIETATSNSEGFTGGDVLTAMRLALAAAVRESGKESRLSGDHILSACAAVRRAEASLRGGYRANAVRGLFTGGAADRSPEHATIATANKEA